MISTVSKIGTGTAVGVLLSFIAIWWIEPATAGGMSLLILIGILISTVMQALIAMVLKSKPE